MNNKENDHNGLTLGMSQDDAGRKARSPSMMNYRLQASELIHT